MKQNAGRFNPFRSILLAGALAIFTLFAAASPAFAQSSSDGDDPDSGLPGAELSGWFFNPDASLFPVAPDPSLPWTSPQNVATLNYWLGLVTELGNTDPALLSELVGLGMITPAGATAIVNGQSLASSVPEPMTSGLMGAALAVLGLYALRHRSGLRRYGVRIFPALQSGE